MAPKKSKRTKKKGFFYRLGNGIYRGAAWCERKYVLYGSMILGGGTLDYFYNDNWVESTGEWIMAAGLGAAFSKLVKYVGERGKEKAEKKMMEAVIGQYERKLERKEEARRNEVENLQRSHKNAIKRAIRSQTEELRKRLKESEDRQHNIIDELSKLKKLEGYQAKQLGKLTDEIIEANEERRRLSEENEGYRSRLDELEKGLHEDGSPKEGDGTIS